MLFRTTNTFVGYNHPLEKTNTVFSGVPFSSTSLSEPSMYGPVMVRESLKLIEDFDVKKGNIFQKAKICDIGDLEVVPGSYEETAKSLRETIGDILAVNKPFLIFIGGEHLITLPIVEALKPKTIIQLDAHADLRKDYMGNDYTHQTWAYHARKHTNIIQIGVRTWNKEELNVKNVKNFSPEEFLKKKIEIKGPVHLTIDMDVFDPAYVETGLPEPDGLTPKTVFSLVEKICKFDMVSMDIVEIADRRLPSKTGFLAAHIIKRTLASKW